MHSEEWDSGAGLFIPCAIELTKYLIISIHWKPPFQSVAMKRLSIAHHKTVWQVVKTCHYSVRYGFSDILLITSQNLTLGLPLQEMWQHHFTRRFVFTERILELLRDNLISSMREGIHLQLSGTINKWHFRRWAPSSLRELDQWFLYIGKVKVWWCGIALLDLAFWRDLMSWLHQKTLLCHVVWLFPARVKWMAH